MHFIQVGCTPLHRAASTGNSELCELLIEEGAEVDATDKAGQTPLMHAVICQNRQVNKNAKLNCVGFVFVFVFILFPGAHGFHCP